MSNALLDLEPKPKKILGFGEAESKPVLSNQPNTSSQPVLSSLPSPGRQPILSSQPFEQPPARPTSKQVTASSQPALSNLTKPSNLLASLPEIKGDTRIPHKYADHLCRMLSPDEQAVYFQLYRLSWGWNKETCFISNPRLSERSNVPLSTMKRAIGKLISKGLLEKTGQTNGFGKEQGVEYRVPHLGTQPVASNQPILSRQPTAGTIKEKDLKRKDIKEDSQKVTRLTPEDKQEMIEMITDLILKDGYSFEQAENQFGGNLTPEDWTAIRTKVEEQN